MLASHSATGGPVPSPPRRRWPAAAHWLIAVLTVGAALLALGTSSSCTLDKMGLGTNVGGGPGGECEQADECAGLFESCEWPTCENQYCGTGRAAAGDPCTDDGGQVCNSRGECVACTEDVHCADNLICQVNLCVNRSCRDGELNGDETDLDCGGTCGPCPNDMRCVQFSDCQSGFCTGAGVCASCSVHEDCQELYWCSVEAGNECVDKNDPGDECDDPVQCASGNCARGGVCCDTPCDGTCRSCIIGFTDQPSGQCAPVVALEDPHGECPDLLVHNCDSDGRGCNGSGDCYVYPTSAVCADQACEDDNQRNVGHCDGMADCQPGSLTPCSPYICSGTACLGSCSDDNQCLTGSYCCTHTDNCKGQPVGSCVSQGGLGLPCGGGNECDTGFCVDGVCCENVCSATCLACAESLTGVADGTCRAVPTNTELESECEISRACYFIDASTGDCRGKVGQPCPGGDDDCLNEQCVDSFCCNELCNGLCETCSGNNSSTQAGVCGVVARDHGDPSGECGPVVQCSGLANTCEGDLGEPCGGANPPCNSNVCENDVCCNIACECGSCAPSGTCGDADYAKYTDPDNDCIGVERCDGNGACGVDCGDALPPTGGGTPTACDDTTNDVCTINCDIGNDCQSTTITCPANYACNVVCSGNQACDDTTINCPDEHACDVTCSGNGACSGSFLVSCTATSPCTLDCATGDANTCDSAELRCGNNSCAATCSGTAVPGVTCGNSCSCTNPSSC